MVFKFYIYIDLGEPAYEMYKLDIDWSPSQHLGHKLALSWLKYSKELTEQQ